MAANQSRRRADPVPDPNPESTNTLVTLPYQELDPDSLRLVEIQPTTGHENDPVPVVSCTLTEAAFRTRPKFEALSYMWGSEPADEAITLNGVPFKVRRNLLDALLFLRGQVAVGKTRQPFWIDAICINQNDVEERTRQLRIMDQIYFRASTVIVWLGSMYTKFQQSAAGRTSSTSDVPRSTSPSPTTGCTEDTPVVLDSNSGGGTGNSIEQNMVRYLRTDPYWKRLWILQEIGRATKLRVCFGSETYSWEHFMHLIEMHNSDGNTGPLRLHRLLRQEKYNDSHTLKRLLEEHREAMCTQPKDKIYGLIGLASDAVGFPMDYKKSLYEVWKDTMVFLNEWGLFKGESQILPTGALVKSLLMANHCDPLSQISREHEDQVDPTQLIDDPNSSLVFQLWAVPLGCIVCVGPSASDIICRPSVASEWRLAIQRIFSGEEIGPAHQEHDRLLQALLECDESEVEMMCFSRPSTVVWEQEHGIHAPPSVQRYVGDVRKRTNVIASQFQQMPQPTTNRLASVQPRVYLAKRHGGNATLRKMGVASGLVQPEDLVCWVRSSTRALLVRVVGNGGFGKCKVRVFGTALATEDMCGSVSVIDYAQRWESLKRGGESSSGLKLQVDAGTIFMLLN